MKKAVEIVRRSLTAPSGKTGKATKVVALSQRPGSLSREQPGQQVAVTSMVQHSARSLGVEPYYPRLPQPHHERNNFNASLNSNERQTMRPSRRRAITLDSLRPTLTQVDSPSDDFSDQPMQEQPSWNRPCVRKKPSATWELDKLQPRDGRSKLLKKGSSLTRTSNGRITYRNEDMNGSHNSPTASSTYSCHSRYGKSSREIKKTANDDTLQGCSRPVSREPRKLPFREQSQSPVSSCYSREMAAPQSSQRFKRLSRIELFQQPSYTHQNNKGGTSIDGYTTDQHGRADPNHKSRDGDESPMLDSSHARPSGRQFNNRRLYGSTEALGGHEGRSTQDNGEQRRPTLKEPSIRPLARRKGAVFDGRMSACARFGRSHAGSVAQSIPRSHAVSVRQNAQSDTVADVHMPPGFDGRTRSRIRNTSTAQGAQGANEVRTSSGYDGTARSSIRNASRAQGGTQGANEVRTSSGYDGTARSSIRNASRAQGAQGANEVRTSSGYDGTTRSKIRNASRAQGAQGANEVRTSSGYDGTARSSIRNASRAQGAQGANEVRTSSGYDGTARSSIRNASRAQGGTQGANEVRTSSGYDGTARSSIRNASRAQGGTQGANEVRTSSGYDGTARSSIRNASRAQGAQGANEVRTSSGYDDTARSKIRNASRAQGGTQGAKEVRTSSGYDGTARSSIRNTSRAQGGTQGANEVRTSSGYDGTTRSSIRNASRAQGAQGANEVRTSSGYDGTTRSKIRNASGPNEVRNSSGYDERTQREIHESSRAQATQGAPGYDSSTQSIPLQHSVVANNSAPSNWRKHVVLVQATSGCRTCDEKRWKKHYPYFKRLSEPPSYTGHVPVNNTDIIWSGLTQQNVNAKVTELTDFLKSMGNVEQRAKTPFGKKIDAAFDELGNHHPHATSCAQTSDGLMRPYRQRRESNLPSGNSERKPISSSHFGAMPEDASGEEGQLEQLLRPKYEVMVMNAKSGAPSASTSHSAPNDGIEEDIDEDFKDRVQYDIEYGIERRHKVLAAADLAGSDNCEKPSETDSTYNEAGKGSTPRKKYRN